MLCRSPQEIIKNPDNVRDLIAYGDPSRYQQLAHKARLLDGIVMAPSILEFLDDITLLQERRWAYDVLRDTEPSVVAAEYGAEALVWTAMQETEEQVFDRQTVVLKKHGYDNDLIRRACLWSRQYDLALPSGADTIKHYRFMERVMSDQLRQIDLPQLIFAATEKPLPSKVLACYGLQVLRSEPSFKHVDGPSQWGIDPGNTVWVDTPLGFILTYKDEPNAIVGFATQGSDQLMIHQLQGSRPVRHDPRTGELKKYPSRGIMSFDWRKVMVQISGQVALGAGFKELAIQQGARNIWCVPRFDEKEPHLTYEQARNAYDVQADRLGFSRGPEGNWRIAAAQVS